MNLFASVLSAGKAGLAFTHIIHQTDFICPVLTIAALAVDVHQALGVDPVGAGSSLVSPPRASDPSSVGISSVVRSLSWQPLE